jgi:hypothetical protein
VGSGPAGLALADMNGDGHLDLVAADDLSNDVGILPGNGDGTFQTETPYAAGVNPVAVAVGDLNGDGRLDIIAVDFDSNELSVFLQTCGDGLPRDADVAE